MQDYGVNHSYLLAINNGNFHVSRKLAREILFIKQFTLHEPCLAFHTCASISDSLCISSTKRAITSGFGHVHQLAKI
jgi:hypothetical protein